MEVGLTELTDEQIEELCLIAEEAARRYILRRVPLKRVEDLNVSVEVEGVKPLTLTVEVDVSLSNLMKGFDVQGLVNGAVKAAFASAEGCLRELSCRLRR